MRRPIGQLCAIVPLLGLAGANQVPPPPDSNTLSIPVVFFDCASADLWPSVRSRLDRAYREFVLPALRPGDTRLALVGHTDRVGNAADNQQLGLRRAEAVREYLISLGTPAG